MAYHAAGTREFVHQDLKTPYITLYQLLYPPGHVHTIMTEDFSYICGLPLLEIRNHTSL